LLNSAELMARQTFPDGTAKYSEYRLGGTSLSSPLLAGIMALANQAAGKTLGFVNPLLYANAGSGAHHDVAADREPDPRPAHHARLG
jgi:hypothetical protein